MKQIKHDPNVVNAPSESEYRQIVNDVYEMMKELRNAQGFVERKSKVPSDLKYYWQRELTQKEIDIARNFHLKAGEQLRNQLEYVMKTLEELDKLQKEIDSKSKDNKITKFTQQTDDKNNKKDGASNNNDDGYDNESINNAINDND